MLEIGDQQISGLVEIQQNGDLIISRNQRKITVRGDRIRNQNHPKLTILGGQQHLHQEMEQDGVLRHEKLNQKAAGDLRRVVLRALRAMNQKVRAVGELQ